jgi:hypothetical protein
MLLSGELDCQYALLSDPGAHSVIAPRISIGNSRQASHRTPGCADSTSEKEHHIREFPARPLTFRSRLLLILNTHIEGWYSAEACSARAMLSSSLQGFSSLFASGGGSMIIFRWIVVGTIVAGGSIALLCYKRLTVLPWSVELSKTERLV